MEMKAVEELGIDVTTLLNEYGPSNDVPTFYENEQGEFVPGDLIPYRRDQQEKKTFSSRTLISCTWKNQSISTGRVLIAGREIALSC